MAGVIDEYVAALKRDLDFDPALARRMADEVEAHLWDAAEADPAWPSAEAERRAVERFGLAREIAAQFATDAVNRQARRSWIVLLATVAVTFVAMRLRVMWLGDAGDSLSVLAPLVDRYAFIAAIARGRSIGWWAFRRSVLPLAICLAAPGRVDCRRHRARRPVRRRRAAACAAGGGGRDRADRAACFPCDRARPPAEADGDAAEGRMNGWRLTGVLSLLLLAMALSFCASGHADVEGLRLVIRATARTSLVLFAWPSPPPRWSSSCPAKRTRWQRRNRRYLGVSFAVSHCHPSRGADRAGADRPDAVLDAHQSRQHRAGRHGLSSSSRR